MLRAKSNALRPHNQGPYITDYHYRTTDPLEDIRAAGDDYWLSVVQLLRAGDEIFVESASGAWSYMATIVKADEVLRVIETRPGSRYSGDYVNSDLLADEQASAAEMKEAQAVEAARVADAEQAVETDDVKPAVKWRGKGKWCIVGYGATISAGFDTREDAEAAMEAEAAKIAEHREAFLTNNVQGRKAA